MLSWEDEDPNLPMSLEINKLAIIFDMIYHFKVSSYEIPDENYHFELTERMMRFVRPEGNSRVHLKIVYYAGHAKPIDTRALVLTRYKLALLVSSKPRLIPNHSSWRNKNRFKCPIVKWGTIRSFI